LRILGQKCTPFHQGCGHIGIVNALHVNALCTTFDGVEQQFGLFAHQNKDGLMGWFFQQFYKKGFQSWYGIHQNKDNPHTHIIIDNVKFEK